MRATAPRIRSHCSGLLGLWVGALLSGCGFQMLGGDTRPLPAALQHVRVDMVAPYEVTEPPLETSLRADLTRRGARVADRVHDGQTVIRLTNLQEKRRVLSVSAEGEVLEFLLTTSVDFEVVREGQALLPVSAISVEQDYSFNAEQVLAKEAEEERLRRYMQAELARLLLLRVDAQLRAREQVQAVGAAAGATPP